MTTLRFDWRHSPVRIGWSWLAVAVAGVLSSGAGAGQAQQPDTPQRFEVASVKLSEDRTASYRITGGPGTSRPGQLVCKNASMWALVGWSYDLKPYGLEGPSSYTSSRYDIVANIPHGATMEQVRAMTRELLKDRLGLVVHNEVRQVPVYELTVSKGGHKLKKAAPLAPGEPLSPFPSVKDLPKDSDGFAILPPGLRGMVGSADGNAIRYYARTQTMQGPFLTFLESASERPVVDATGLTGEYDFNLFVSQSLANPSAAAAQATGAIPPADDAPAPDLFSALERQLGLKLRPAKGPVTVLVVDSYHREPNDN